MNDLDTATSFRLVYEGPVDDSPDTLRKLKGIFISDLELSISEVQQILLAPPATLRAAATEGELKSLHKRIQDAGGKVHLVRPAATEASDTGAVLEFSLEEILSTPTPAPKEKSAPKVYELSLDDTELPPELTGDPPPLELNTALPDEPSLPDLDQPLFDLESKPHSSESADQPLALDPMPSKALHSEQDRAPVRHETSKTLNAPADDLSLSLDLGAEPVEPASVAAPVEEIDLSLTPEEPAPAPKTAPPSTSDSRRVAGASFSLDDDPVESAAPAPTAAKPRAEAPKPPAGVPAQQAHSQAEASSVDAKPAATPPAEPPPIDSAPRLADLKVKREASPSGEADAAAPLPASPEDEPRDPWWSKVPFETLIPILVGTVILGYVNWSYFAKPDPQAGDKANREAAALLAKQAKLPKSTTVTPARPPPAEWRGSSDDGVAAVAISATFGEDGQGGNVKISLTTPEPPPLTPEQIVRNEPRAPWLQKLEGEVRLTMQDGVFSGSGTLRGVLDYRNQRRRLVAPITVTVRAQRDDRSGEATIQIGEPLSSSSEASAAVPPVLRIENDSALVRLERSVPLSR